MGKKNLSYCIAILTAYFLSAFVSLLLLDSALKKKQTNKKITQKLWSEVMLRKEN